MRPGPAVVPDTNMDRTGLANSPREQILSKLHFILLSQKHRILANFFWDRFRHMLHHPTNFMPIWSTRQSTMVFPLQGPMISCRICMIMIILPILELQNVLVLNTLAICLYIYMASRQVAGARWQVPLLPPEFFEGWQAASACGRWLGECGRRTPIKFDGCSDGNFWYQVTKFPLFPSPPTADIAPAAPSRC